MSNIRVVAKKDFLQSLTVVTPLMALSEMIWNGFDAQSPRVNVHFDIDTLGGIETIRIRDYGSGIDHSQVETLFGSLGDSWKKSAVRKNGRALHGKSGKGRFRAFALGNQVAWNTTYRGEDGKAKQYTIRGRASTLDNFEIFDPVETGDANTGTEVVISNIKHEFGSLTCDSASMDLAKRFAAYLTEYPDLVLDYNGVSIDPRSVQASQNEYPLDDVELGEGRKAKVTVSIIEWNIQTDRALHLCDENGISLHEVQAGQQVRAPGFNFTAYVKSDHFRELDKQNELILEELSPDVLAIIKAAKSTIKEHFRRRLLENRGQIVARWKKEEIYPYEEKPDLGPVETAERQVFDILAVNVENYLPSFEDADAQSKKFTFKLIAQAIRDNPESVQKIIGEVLGLKKEAQDEFAQLLYKTPLTAIISTAKIVANRLDFLVSLENLLFDPKNKLRLLERDQLHKILETEAWIFDEAFGLAGSEIRLEEVLHIHIGKLGKREDTPSPVKLPDGTTGRIDLMLHKVVQPRAGEYDYLVVELKRPKKKIDAEVLTQIQNYAIAVAGDERFREVPATWKFLAVSNDLDEFAKRQTAQRERPKGLVFDDAEHKITVWVRGWAEIINNARARLSFINQHLAYEADQASAKEYLKKTHAKYIPNLDQPEDGKEDPKDEDGSKE